MRKMEDSVRKTAISTKRCTTCDVDKTIDNFAKRTASKDGLRVQCRLCASVYNRERFLDPINVAKKTERNFRNNLKKFGLTPETFEAIVVVQSNLCKICGNPETRKNHISGKTLRLAVDHCHTTGKVRGLLCSKCNRSIGLLGDDYESVLRAAEYLRDNG